jgi:hypothetical protein
MERYFTFKYYLEVGEIILLLLFLAFCVLCIIVAKLLDKWEERLNKKSDKYWKEHEDERS